MRFITRFIFAALVAACIAPASAHADAFDCTGYPQPRVYIGHQTGWADLETTDYASAEHVHAEYCFPEHQTVSGNVTVDVVVKVHNAPQPLNRVKRVRIYARSNTNDYSWEVVEPKDAGGNYLHCATADCTWVVPVTMATGSIADGKYEWRVQVETTRDPASLNSRTLTTGADIACVDTCTGVTPEVPYKEARGWYKMSTGVIAGYVNARWGFSLADDALFPWQNGTYVAKSGTWCPPIRTLLGSQEGPAVTIDESFVAVDPDFHHGSSGVANYTKAGTLSNGDYCVDTTTLANGMHKLFWRAHATSPFTGQLWGSYVIGFNVQN